MQRKKASLVERRQELNLKEIQEHERKYIAGKHFHELEQSRQHRTTSVNRPVLKYEKNVWASIV
jgi:hypothetical protein